MTETRNGAKYIDKDPPMADDPDLKRKVVDYLAYLKEQLNFMFSTEGKRMTSANGNINELYRTAEETISIISDPDDGLISKINQNAQAISTEVTRATGEEGNLSTRITQNATDITSKVSQTDYNGNTIASKINQNATTVTIDASKVNLNGYVTFSNLSTSGDVNINGDNITSINGSKIVTGTISADRIAANETFTQKLYAQDLNITGGSIDIQTSADNDDRINLQRSRYGGQENYSSNFAPERFQVLRTTTGNSRECSANMGPESLTIGRSTIGQTYYDYSGVMNYFGINFTSGAAQQNGIYMVGPLSAQDGMGEIKLLDANGRTRMKIDSTGLTFYDASGNVTRSYPAT